MLNNLTIKSRLVFVVGFLSIMLVGGGIIGIGSLGMANQALRTNYEAHLVPVGKIDQVVRLINQNQLSIAQSLSLDDATVGAELDQVDKRIAEIGTIWQQYMTSGLAGDEKALADKFAASRGVFVAEGLKPAIAALRANDKQKAAELMRDKMNPLFAPVRDNVDALIGFQLEQAKREFERSQFIYNIVRAGCMAGILFGVLIGAAICVWLVRAISRPIDAAVRVARSVAAGDLTQRIDVSSHDEVGQLMQALKEMNESLVRIVGQVRNGTETIASASSQIAAGNHDLSGRTEMQASSLEETASSMEQLTGTVRQNAASALQANQLALSASEVATKGGAVVSEVVQTMGAINDSARKIEDIIGVIDGIAFQTNILALNAAVEAARAGEQGRGFAVVATEVRNLAQRSSGAAREIKTLIADSVEKVHTGAKLVDEAGATMADIVTSVRRVTDIMGEISVASREQTTGIEQVNLAITQMDQATQQNAALVEESAAAAESMQEEASNLAHVVSVFKLDGVPHAAARPIAQARAVAAPRKAAPAKAVGGGTAVRKIAAAPKRVQATAAVAGDTDWEEF